MPYPQTQRTWIIESLSAGEDATSAVVHRLMELYLEPLCVASMAVHGHSREQAIDLVQGFFAQRLVGTGYLERWSKTSILLRHWLWSGVWYFHKEWLRFQRRLPTVSEIPESIDDRQEDPPSAFDRAFRTSLVLAAMRRAEARCIEDGFATHWRVFVRYSEVHSQSAVAAELGLSSSEVAVRLRAPKRRLIEALKMLLIQDGVSPLEVPAAIRALRQAT